MPPKRKSSLRPPPSEAQIKAAADTLNQLAGDPNLIEGIYNYYDRLCERCAFTARCLSFKMDRATSQRGAAKVPSWRSIGAWARLRDHFAGKADAMLDLLVQLERLRRAVEREFPSARASRRPGLD